MRSILVISSTFISWLVAGLALAASSQRIELKHVVITYDESAWVGNKIEIPNSDKSAAALVDPAHTLAVLVFDIPIAEKEKSSNDMLERAARASLMAKGLYKQSLTESKKMFVIDSKRLPGGWVCMQGAVKKADDAAETSVIYCASMDQAYWVYASLESKDTPTQGEFAAFRGLLNDVSP